jgi:hypothetical protein
MSEPTKICTCHQCEIAAAVAEVARERDEWLQVARRLWRYNRRVTREQKAVLNAADGPTVPTPR